jgi:cytidylate kinase
MAVITISRQYGAGGKTLGKMIADELDYEFGDSEIIAKVAEMANVSRGQALQIYYPDGFQAIGRPYFKR